MPKPSLIRVIPETPVTEVTDSGIYIRFGAPRPVRATVIRRQWPLLAVDVDAAGLAIGIEAIPRPKVGLRRLAEQAGVLLT